MLAVVYPEAAPSNPILGFALGAGRCGLAGFLAERRFAAHDAMAAVPVHDGRRQRPELAEQVIRALGQRLRRLVRQP